VIQEYFYLSGEEGFRDLEGFFSGWFFLNVKCKTLNVKCKREGKKGKEKKGKSGFLILKINFLYINKI
jgi:hypothetical protein